MTATELLPCPFCGGGCVVQDDVVRGGKTMWHVYHFCKGPIGHHGHYGHADTTEIQTAYFDTLGQSIAAWNRRAGDADGLG